MKINHCDTDKQVIIIAEIGNNHEGHYSLAEEMICASARAGADAVKFQTIIPDKLVSIKNAKRIEQLERMRLSRREFEKLSEVARKKNVLFLSTPFDIESAKFLDPIIPAYKISSGDCDFYPLLECAAKTGKPVIFSAGLADLAQIRKTKSFIESVWQKNNIKQDMAILHCVSRYPTPKEEANLGFIETLKELGIVIGYSDHTLGIEVAVAAAQLGARIIEKHFTLDKNFSDFHDHQLSADPDDFARLVKEIRHHSARLAGAHAFLAGKRRFDDLIALRRSVVAACDLKPDCKVQAGDLDWVRPGGGLPPGEEQQLIGKILTREISKGEMIFPKDVK